VGADAARRCGRARRWVVAGVAVAGLAASLPGAPPALASHGHGPSARAVAAGRAAVARREQEVRRAAALVASTQKQLAALGVQAETAVEAFDAARLTEQSAQGEVAAARLVLRTAAQQLHAAQRRVNAFTTAAYMSGGISTMQALITTGGPQAMLDRVGTIQQISQSQNDASQALDAARVYQVSVTQEAQAALDRATAAAHAAAAAQQRAQAAVTRQTALLAGLTQRRHALAVLLRQAQAHASALERARLAAIARAKALAAARARARAAQQAKQTTGQTGATGNVPGTVSAATEQRAVSYAKSQIGKPYQWGAAGPDSYDCSGLTMWAYAQVGVTIDHWTGYQWQEGARVSTSAMRPGDLAFFATDTNDPNTIHHVGMYIGNGEMVEAPYTGADVRISSVWRPDLIGVIRPYAR
jgi:cell wall-associated NlpC family hydrolase